jgi:uncharacterized membrane protein YfcA
MPFDLAGVLPLLLIVAAGAYVQTVAGFAFGLIFMGVTGSLNLLPISTAAIIVSLLAFINTGTALIGNHKQAHWPAVIATLVASLPAMGIGYWLLNYLSENALSVLRHLLGVTIFICALMILKPPREGSKASPLFVYGFYGAMGGVLGGLFATTGPPLVFQFYRQPLTIPVIRDSLLAIFLISSACRTAIVTLSDQMTGDVLWIAGFALPVVILATILGRRFPPPLPEKTIRQGVFLLLVLSAIALIIK